MVGNMNEPTKLALARYNRLESSLWRRAAIISAIIGSPLLILTNKETTAFALMVLFIFIWGGLSAIQAAKTDKPIQAILYYIGVLIFSVGAFANIYWHLGVDEFKEAPIKNDFLASLYFSIVTWTSLGYGDIKPVREARAWVAAESIMGYIYMGILVGLIIFYLTNSKSTER